MEEETDPSKEYIDAFNLGYELNKTSPEMAELISGLKGDSQVLNGMKQGAIVYGEEQKAPSRLPDWLLKDRFNENKPDLSDKNKDKGIEPER